MSSDRHRLWRQLGAGTPRGAAARSFFLERRRSGDRLLRNSRRFCLNKISTLSLAALFAVAAAHCASPPRCNYGFAQRAGVAAARNNGRLGSYPSRCAAEVRPEVERGYREGLFSAMGCQLPPTQPGTATVAV